MLLWELKIVLISKMSWQFNSAVSRRNTYVCALPTAICGLQKLLCAVREIPELPTFSCPCLLQ